MPPIKTIEDALVAILQGDSAVTDLVSDRIFPNISTEDFKGDYIVYNMLTAPLSQVHESKKGLLRPLLSLDIYSPIYGNVREIAARVVIALHGFTGTIVGVTIQFTRAEGGPDNFNEVTKLHQKNVDVNFILEGPLT